MLTSILRIMSLLHINTTCDSLPPQVSLHELFFDSSNLSLSLESF